MKKPTRPLLSRPCLRAMRYPESAFPPGILTAQVLVNVGSWLAWLRNGRAESPAHNPAITKVQGCICAVATLQTERFGYTRSVLFSINHLYMYLHSSVHSYHHRYYTVELLSMAPPTFCIHSFLVVSYLGWWSIAQHQPGLLHARHVR